MRDKSKDAEQRKIISKMLDNIAERKLELIPTRERGFGHTFIIEELSYILESLDCKTRILGKSEHKNSITDLSQIRGMGGMASDSLILLVDARNHNYDPDTIIDYCAINNIRVAGWGHCLYCETSKPIVDGELLHHEVEMFIEGNNLRLNFYDDSGMYKQPDGVDITIKNCPMCGRKLEKDTNQQ